MQRTWPNIFGIWEETRFLSPYPCALHLCPFLDGLHLPFSTPLVCNEMELTHYAMKAYVGMESWCYRCMSVGTRWRWVGRFTHLLPSTTCSHMM
jgi:hypothetical protein